jgi:hypothetical protein
MRSIRFYLRPIQVLKACGTLMNADMAEANIVISIISVDDVLAYY